MTPVNTATIAQNKKAYFDYTILKKYTAGIVLIGCEVKSIRQRLISLKESYVTSLGNELFLVGCHITPYSHASHQRHRIEAVRDRKLLLNRHEINYLSGKVAEKRLTIVPLAIYFDKQRVKLSIGLAQSKKQYDKRHVLKDKAINRDIARDYSHRLA